MEGQKPMIGEIRKRRLSSARGTPIKTLSARKSRDRKPIVLRESIKINCLI